MFSNLYGAVKNLLFISISGQYKTEFEISNNTINLNRAKTTVLAFSILELGMLVFSILIKGKIMFLKPNIYYVYMYLLNIISMFFFLYLFMKLEKNIRENSRKINWYGICFTIFLLAWCAGVSLLDLHSYNQIVIYVVAILCIAVTPIYKPYILLVIFLAVHSIYLIGIFSERFGTLRFGNVVNSTSVLVIAWVISYMIYKNRIQEFCTKKELQEKSIQLNRLNKELEEANKQLEWLSEIDTLTGIYNRSVFDRRMLIEWERCKQNGVYLSFVMIDIDNFKAYNDCYGHQAGDMCIHRVAEALSICATRSSDVVARYGGEEFAVILPHIDQENALCLAEKMREAVEKLNILHEYTSAVSQYVTISLGIFTTIPSDFLTMEEFIKQADNALYIAKKDGRNKVVAIQNLNTVLAGRNYNESYKSHMLCK
jgi:diguanylate cyclase (GGDEF) domain